jgi:hypothetical protein
MRCLAKSFSTIARFPLENQYVSKKTRNVSEQTLARHLSYAIAFTLKYERPTLA